MFAKDKKCDRCEEKDKQIKYLKDQIKDLQDRFLSLSPQSLAAYKEVDKPKEDLPLEPLMYKDDDGNWVALSVDETKEWHKKVEQTYASYLEEPEE